MVVSSQSFVVRSTLRLQLLAYPKLRHKKPVKASRSEREKNVRNKFFSLDLLLGVGKTLFKHFLLRRSKEQTGVP